MIYMKVKIYVMKFMEASFNCICECVQNLALINLQLTEYHAVTSKIEKKCVKKLVDIY